MITSSRVPCLGKLRPDILGLLFGESCGENSCHDPPPPKKKSPAGGGVPEGVCPIPQRPLSCREPALFTVTSSFTEGPKPSERHGSSLSPVSQARVPTAQHANVLFGFGSVGPGPVLLFLITSGHEPLPMWLLQNLCAEDTARVFVCKKSLFFLDTGVFTLELVILFKSM